MSKNIFKYEKIFLNFYKSLIASSQSVIVSNDDLCIILFPVSSLYF